MQQNFEKQYHINFLKGINIKRSTKEFKHILENYSKHKELMKKYNTPLREILFNIQRKKAELGESDVELIYNEIKNERRVHDELLSEFGVNFKNHYSSPQDVKKAEQKAAYEGKLEKSLFFTPSTNSAPIKVIKKKSRIENDSNIVTSRNVYKSENNINNFDYGFFSEDNKDNKKIIKKIDLINLPIIYPSTSKILNYNSSKKSIFSNYNNQKKRFKKNYSISTPVNTTNNSCISGMTKRTNLSNYLNMRNYINDLNKMTYFYNNASIDVGKKSNRFNKGYEKAKIRFALLNARMIMNKVS